MSREYDWITYGAGVAYMRHGRYQAAEQKFHEVLVTNPDHGNAYAQLGIIQKSAGQANKAKALFEKALQHDPENEITNCQLGLLHLQNHNFPDAADSFSRVLFNNPSHTAALINLGLVFGKQGDFDKAKKLIEHVYYKDKDLNDCFAKLGWIKTENSDWLGALEIMSQDQKSGRLSSSWQVNLALVSAHLGDFKSAETLVESAYCRNDRLRDGFARVAWIKVVGPVKDLPGADLLMKRDLKTKRISPTWKIWMASLKSGLGNMRTAEYLVKEAYSEDAKVSDGFGRLGWFSFLFGNSAHFLDEMIEKDIRLDRFQTLGKLLKAVHIAVTGSIERAIKIIQVVIRENPEVKDYFTLIGWLCLKYGNPKTCCELMSRDYATNRMSLLWYPTYAVALNTQGQTQAAQKILEVVLQFKKDSDLILVGISLIPDAVMTCVKFRQFIEQGFGFKELT